MRWLWLGLVAVVACGGNSGPPLLAHTQFTVTDFSGHGPSPLDPLQNQVIDITVEWPKVDSNYGDGSDPAGCLSTYVGLLASTRTASGATAALVQSQILDPLGDWDIRLQLCDQAGASSVTLESVINELNLSIGCFGLPPVAMQKDSTGHPSLVSFTAMQCSSTILDVVNNRVIGGHDFALTIEAR